MGRHFFAWNFCRADDYQWRIGADFHFRIQHDGNGFFNIYIHWYGDIQYSYRFCDESRPPCCC